MRKYSRLAMLALLVPLATAGAQAAAEPVTDMPRYGEWYSSRIGGGGYVINVVTCPTNPNRLYTYIDVGGVYISEDRGQHWRMLHGGLPPMRGNYSVRGLLVDPRDDNKLIIITGSRSLPSHGIFTSDDAGKTWKPAEQKIFFDGNAAARDAGNLLVRHPHNPDVILAACVNDGLWRSQDNGKTWRQLGMKGLFPTDLEIDQKNPDRMWLSAMSTSLWHEGKEYTFKAGFFRSLDGGVTWTKLSDKAPYEMVQDPQSANTLFANMDRSMIRRSVDGGDTWEDFSDGLMINTAKIQGDSVSSYRYRAIGAGPDFIALASCKGDIYTLKNGSSKWQMIKKEKIIDHNLPRGKDAWGWATASIVVDPRDARHWFITDYFGVSETHDAGKSWEIIVNGLENTVVHYVAQDPGDPAVVHLGMADNAYFVSRDGGATFRNRKFPDNAGTCKNMDISPKLSNRIYAVGSGEELRHIARVFISNDRGESWQRSPMKGLPDLIATKAACASIAADPENADVAYITVSGTIKNDQGGVYKTSDAGQNWTWMGQGLPEMRKFFNASPWSQGQEIAAGSSGALVTISKSSSNSVFYFDSASHKWQPGKIDLSGGLPRCVTADVLTPGRFYMGVLGSGIYRTTDSGRTWRRVFTGSASYVNTDKAKRDRVAASTADGVVYSSDGGETWTTLDKSLPDRVFGNMPAFAGDRIVVGSDGSGAFWIPLTPDANKPVKASGQ